MGLFDRLRGALGGDEEEDANYRCLRCGAYFERQHRTCPECGGAFVAPLEPGAESERERERSPERGEG